MSPKGGYMEKEKLEINNLIIYGIGIIILLMSLKFKFLFGVFGGYFLGSLITRTFDRGRKNREVDYLKWEKISKKDENEEEVKIKELLNKYSIFYINDFFGPSAKTTSNQIMRFDEKHRGIVKTLGEKFEVTELTYAKFMGTIGLVYDALYDNFEEIRSKLDVLEEIDFDRINNRIIEIKNLPTLKEETINELKTLKERKEIAENSLAEVNRIISINEELITDFDKLRVKVSELKRKDTRSILDLDYTRAELDKLIKNTKAYNI